MRRALARSAGPLLASALACGGPALTNASLGEPIVLRPGRTGLLAGEQLEVTFTRVIADSRCPTQVVCIWEGVAIVEMGVSRAGAAPVAFNLATTSSAGHSREATAAGYRFELLSLIPQPHPNRAIQRDEYAVTLVVTRDS